MNPKRHFYLYAKHHYEDTWPLEDLRKIAADYSGVPENMITEKALWEILIPEVWNQIKNSGNPLNHFKEFVYFLLENLRVESSLKRLMPILHMLQMAEVEHIGELGDPDPEILPLSNGELFNAKKKAGDICPECGGDLEGIDDGYPCNNCGYTEGE